MKFRCRACGAKYEAMKWNNAARDVVDENEFQPIQNVYDSDRLWYCPNCSEDKADVRVELIEE
ncbi:hypothetical protein [Halarsenatibacter silvermanii]|uniref:Rubredoxin n=1 Tax=Halarsenatibacter silvermanii TaxID=321763 RepID=A0A1G9RWH2_9FIRM|nr:hypothetical protein [Halarsenatibacter silvermanii]SDM27609.1 hypothetical protein SAMN04488692_12433 [Halarsenatibacter silvermanii]